MHSCRHLKQKSVGEVPKFHLAVLSTEADSLSRIDSEGCLPSSMALKKIVLVRKIQELQMEKQKMDRRFQMLVDYYQHEMEARNLHNKKLSKQIKDLKANLNDMRKDIRVIDNFQSKSKSKKSKILSSSSNFDSGKKAELKSRKKAVKKVSSPYFSASNLHLQTPHKTLR